MTVKEFDNKINVSIEKILKLCKKLEINVTKETDILSEDEMALIEFELENNASYNDTVSSSGGSSSRNRNNDSFGEFNIDNESFASAYKCLKDAYGFIENGLGDFTELDNSALKLIKQDGINNNDRLTYITNECRGLEYRMSATIETLCRISYENANFFYNIFGNEFSESLSEIQNEQEVLNNFSNKMGDFVITDEFGFQTYDIDAIKEWVIENGMSNIVQISNFINGASIHNLSIDNYIGQLNSIACEQGYNGWKDYKSELDKGARSLGYKDYDDYQKNSSLKNKDNKKELDMMAREMGYDNYQQMEDEYNSFILEKSGYYSNIEQLEMDRLSLVESRSDYASKSSELYKNSALGNKAIIDGDYVGCKKNGDTFEVYSQSINVGYEYSDSFGNTYFVKGINDVPSIYEPKAVSYYDLYYGSDAYSEAQNFYDNVDVKSLTVGNRNDLTLALGTDVMMGFGNLFSNSINQPDIDFIIKTNSEVKNVKNMITAFEKDNQDIIGQIAKVDSISYVVENHIGMDDYFQKKSDIYSSNINVTEESLKKDYNILIDNIMSQAIIVDNVDINNPMSSGQVVLKDNEDIERFVRLVNNGVITSKNAYSSSFTGDEITMMLPDKNVKLVIKVEDNRENNNLFTNKDNDLTFDKEQIILSDGDTSFLSLGQDILNLVRSGNKYYEIGNWFKEYAPVLKTGKIEINKINEYEYKDLTFSKSEIDSFDLYINNTSSNVDTTYISRTQSLYVLNQIENGSNDFSVDGDQVYYVKDGKFIKLRSEDNLLSTCLRENRKDNVTLATAMNMELSNFELDINYLDNYNYIYNTKGANAAFDYYLNVLSDIDERAIAVKDAKDRDFADRNPGLASVGSIVVAPFEGFKVFNYAIEKAIKDESVYRVNTYSSGDTMRAQVGSNIANSGSKNAAINGFLYNTGMSMADNIYGSLIFGPNGVGISLFAGSFDNSYNEAVDRGIDPSKACNYAISMGTLEGLTEQLSFNSFLKVSGLGNSDSILLDAFSNKVSNLLKSKGTDGVFTLAGLNSVAGTVLQASSEGFEELVSSVGGRWIDNLMNGDLSGQNLRYVELINSGYTPAEASNAIFIENVNEDVTSVLSGMVSGGAMAGPTTFISNFSDNGIYKNSLTYAIANEDYNLLFNSIYDKSGANLDVNNTVARITLESLIANNKINNDIKLEIEKIIEEHNSVLSTTNNTEIILDEQLDELELLSAMQVRLEGIADTEGKSLEELKVEFQDIYQEIIEQYSNVVEKKIDLKNEENIVDNIAGVDNNGFVLDDLTSSDLVSLQDAVHKIYKKYSTTEERTAQLAYLIANNKMFGDNSNRMALITMIQNLKMEGKDATYDQEVLTSLISGIGLVGIKQEHLLTFINKIDLTMEDVKKYNNITDDSLNTLSEVDRNIKLSQAVKNYLDTLINGAKKEYGISSRSYLRQEHISGYMKKFNENNTDKSRPDYKYGDLREDNSENDVSESIFRKYVNDKIIEMFNNISKDELQKVAKYLNKDVKDVTVSDYKRFIDIRDVISLLSKRLAKGFDLNNEELLYGIDTDDGIECRENLHRQLLKDKSLIVAVKKAGMNNIDKIKSIGLYNIIDAINQYAYQYMEENNIILEEGKLPIELLAAKDPEFYENGKDDMMSILQDKYDGINDNYSKITGKLAEIARKSKGTLLGYKYRKDGIIEHSIKDKDSASRKMYSEWLSDLGDYGYKLDIDNPKNVDGEYQLIGIKENNKDQRFIINKDGFICNLDGELLVVDGNNINVKLDNYVPKDLLRYTIMSDGKNYVSTVISSIRSLELDGYKIISSKFSWPGSFYQGINLTIEKDGQIFELQFHTEESFYAKDDGTHTFYEIKRNKVFDDLAVQDVANYAQMLMQSQVEVPVNTSKFSLINDFVRYAIKYNKKISVSKMNEITGDINALDELVLEGELKKNDSDYTEFMKEFIDTTSEEGEFSLGDFLSEYFEISSKDMMTYISILFHNNKFSEINIKDSLSSILSKYKINSDLKEKYISNVIDCLKLFKNLRKAYKFNDNFIQKLNDLLYNYQDFIEKLFNNKINLNTDIKVFEEFVSSLKKLYNYSREDVDEVRNDDADSLRNKIGIQFFANKSKDKDLVLNNNIALSSNDGFFGLDGIYVVERLLINDESVNELFESINASRYYNSQYKKEEVLFGLIKAFKIDSSFVERFSERYDIARGFCNEYLAYEAKLNTDQDVLEFVSNYVQERTIPGSKTDLSQFSLFDILSPFNSNKYGIKILRHNLIEKLASRIGGMSQKFMYRVLNSVESYIINDYKYSMITEYIFNKFEGNSERFEYVFGFPMYIDGGLNKSMLVVDIYSYMLSSQYEGMSASEIFNFLIYSHGKLDVVDELISNYLVDRGIIDKKEDFIYKSIFDSKTAFTDNSNVNVVVNNIVSKVSDSLNNGRKVMLSLNGSESIYGNALELRDIDGKLVAKIYNGDSISVVGVTSDNMLIVENSNGRYYIDLNKALIFGNRFSISEIELELLKLDDVQRLKLDTQIDVSNKKMTIDEFSKQFSDRDFNLGGFIIKGYEILDFVSDERYIDKLLSMSSNGIVYADYSASDMIYCLVKLFQELDKNGLSVDKLYPHTRKIYNEYSSSARKGLLNNDSDIKRFASNYVARINQFSDNKHNSKSVVNGMKELSDDGNIDFDTTEGFYEKDIELTEEATKKLDNLFNNNGSFENVLRILKEAVTRKDFDIIPDRSKQQLDGLYYSQIKTYLRNKICEIIEDDIEIFDLNEFFYKKNNVSQVGAYVVITADKMIMVPSRHGSLNYTLGDIFEYLDKDFESSKYKNEAMMRRDSNYIVINLQNKESGSSNTIYSPDVISMNQYKMLQEFNQMIKEFVLKDKFFRPGFLLSNKFVPGSGLVNVYNIDGILSRLFQRIDSSERLQLVDNTVVKQDVIDEETDNDWIEDEDFDIEDEELAYGTYPSAIDEDMYDDELQIEEDEIYYAIEDKLFDKYPDGVVRTNALGTTINNIDVHSINISTLLNVVRYHYDEIISGNFRIYGANYNVYRAAINQLYEYLISGEVDISDIPVDVLNKLRSISESYLSDRSRMLEEVNRTVGSLKNVEYDIVVLDNGVECIYEKGTDMNFVIEKINSIFNKMPEKLKGATKKIVLNSSNNNPGDAYWGFVYGVSGFKTAASAGQGTESIILYKDMITKINSSDILGLSNERRIYHEVAHNFDEAMGGISTSNEWNNAINEDGNYPSNYAKNGIREDFAESVADYFMNREQFTKKFPNRAKILEQLFSNEVSIQSNNRNNINSKNDKAFIYSLKFKFNNLINYLKNDVKFYEDRVESVSHKVIDGFVIFSKDFDLSLKQMGEYFGDAGINNSEFGKKINKLFLECKTANEIMNLLNLEEQRLFKEFLNTDHGVFLSKLSTEEIKSLIVYTGNGYNKVNTALQNGKLDGKVLFRDSVTGEKEMIPVETIVKNIDSVIRKAGGVKEDSVYYRGVSGNIFLNQDSVLSEAFKSIQNKRDVNEIYGILRNFTGFSFEYFGYVSASPGYNTSYAKRPGFPIVLEILTPEGTNGAYINQVSKKYNVENEFLYARDVSFKILDVQLLDGMGDVNGADKVVVRCIAESKNEDAVKARESVSKDVIMDAIEFTMPSMMETSDADLEYFDDSVFGDEESTGTNEGQVDTVSIRYVFNELDNTVSRVNIDAKVVDESFQKELPYLDRGDSIGLGLNGISFDVNYDNDTFVFGNSFAEKFEQALIKGDTSFNVDVVFMLNGKYVVKSVTLNLVDDDIDDYIYLLSDPSLTSKEIVADLIDNKKSIWISDCKSQIDNYIKLDGIVNGDSNIISFLNKYVGMQGNISRNKKIMSFLSKNIRLQTFIDSCGYSFVEDYLKLIDSSWKNNYKIMLDAFMSQFVGFGTKNWEYLINVYIITGDINKFIPEEYRYFFNDPNVMNYVKIQDYYWGKDSTSKYKFIDMIKNILEANGVDWVLYFNQYLVGVSEDVVFGEDYKMFFGTNGFVDIDSEIEDYLNANKHNVWKLTDVIHHMLYDNNGNIKQNILRILNQYIVSEDITLIPIDYQMFFNNGDGLKVKQYLTQIDRYNSNVVISNNVRNALNLIRTTLGNDWIKKINYYLLYRSKGRHYSIYGNFTLNVNQILNSATVDEIKEYLSAFGDYYGDVQSVLDKFKLENSNWIDILNKFYTTGDLNYAFNGVNSLYRGLFSLGSSTSAGSIISYSDIELFLGVNNFRGNIGLSDSTREKLNAIRNGIIGDVNKWIFELNKFIYHNGSIPLINCSISINGVNVNINTIISSINIEDIKQYLIGCGEYYANFTAHTGIEFMNNTSLDQARMELRCFVYMNYNDGLSWDLLSKHFIPEYIFDGGKADSKYGDFDYGNPDKSGDSVRYEIPYVDANGNSISVNRKPPAKPGGIYHFTYGESYNFRLKDGKSVRIRIHSEDLNERFNGNRNNRKWSINIYIDGKNIGFDGEVGLADNHPKVHIMPKFTLDEKNYFKSKIISRLGESEFSSRPDVVKLLQDYHFRNNSSLD